MVAGFSVNLSRRAGLLCFALVYLLGTIANANHRKEASKVWSTTTFLDFVEGSLADGGVNSYVAADGTIRLINLRDLNNDGHLDVVLPNTHNNNAKIDLFIYWGKDRHALDGRTRLPTNGGYKSTAADLNGDAFMDLIVVNRTNGTKPDLNTYIYWGSEQGFQAGHRTELPTQCAEAAAVADLNRDGHPDLVIANSGLAYHVALDHFQKSYIYWGSKEGFSKDRRSILKTIHARDVKVADLNQDDCPDIVFAMEGNSEGEAGALIYWGNDRGDFSRKRSVQLPGERCSALELADLDGDGTVEIILANSFRLREREAGIYNIIDTALINSFIYWGSSTGYAADRRTELPTVKARGVAVGDLNADGRPDIVFANASGGSSSIYWAASGGFRANRRTSLPTLGATDCTIADLNGDGHPDLVFANSSDGHRKEIDSFIYWGGPDGIVADRLAKVPTQGTTGVVAADLDRDNKLDLVFTNEEDGIDGGEIDSWVYWGNQRGLYSRQRRIALPTRNTYGYTAADLDNDGHVDLFFSGSKSVVYRGSAEGFSKQNKSVISSRFAFSALAADFNRDGYLDLSLSEWGPGVDDANLYWGGPGGFSQSNRFVFPVDSKSRLTQHTLADLDKDGWLDLILPTWDGVLLFKNGPDGFDNSRKTVLPCAGAVSGDVADLNGDGYLDIIIANLFQRQENTGEFQSFGGSPQGDTYIYWGSKKGFSPARRLILPSIGTEDIAVADLNSDGHLDLVLSSYHAGYTRSHPSYVYWNSSSGFDPKRVTMLPTHSASGVMVADFNQDGRKDILFACHKRDGDHGNDSFLYWGSPAGFFPERRGLIFGQGPHFLTAVDAGDVHRRGDRYDYVSPPFDAGPHSRFERITWTGKTPFRTDLVFQVRMAVTRDGLAAATWRGPKGPGSVFRNPGTKLKDTSPEHRWIQYKAGLVSPDSVNTPVLESVSIHYSTSGGG